MVRHDHLLERILDSDPGMSEADLAGLRRPALVLANAEDPMHPLALAERLETEFWTMDERLANRCKDLKLAWVHWVGEI